MRPVKERRIMGRIDLLARRAYKTDETLARDRGGIPLGKMTELTEPRFVSFVSAPYITRADHILARLTDRSGPRIVPEGGPRRQPGRPAGPGITATLSRSRSPDRASAAGRCRPGSYRASAGPRSDFPTPRAAWSIRRADR